MFSRLKNLLPISYERGYSNTYMRKFSKNTSNHEEKQERNKNRAELLRGTKYK